MARLILTAAILLVTMVGCETDHGLTAEPLPGKYYIHTIDGCEYILWVKDRHSGITHKGNCNNLKHLTKCDK